MRVMKASTFAVTGFLLLINYSFVNMNKNPTRIINNKKIKL